MVDDALGRRRPREMTEADYRVVGALLIAAAIVLFFIIH